MEKILVAIDGSTSCNKAAEKAQNLAFLCNSNVTFITIVENPKYKVVTSREKFEEKQELIDQDKKESADYLNKCNNIYTQCKISMKAKGLETNKVVKKVRDNPAKDICDYARENNYDLIVITDKGHSNIKNFLLGSTTEKVVRHSKVSVLVVK